MKQKNLKPEKHVAVHCRGIGAQRKALPSLSKNILQIIMLDKVLRFCFKKFKTSKCVEVAAPVTTLPHSIKLLCSSLGTAIWAETWPPSCPSHCYPQEVVFLNIITISGTTNNDSFSNIFQKKYNLFICRKILQLPNLSLDILKLISKISFNDLDRRHTPIVLDRPHGVSSHNHPPLASALGHLLPRP